MSDIDDWEKEADNMSEEEQPQKKIYAEESETVIKDVKAKIERKPKEDDDEDYEKKWQLKNKGRIEKRKKEIQAMENLDEETRNKMLAELDEMAILDEQVKEEEDEKEEGLNLTLESEQDFRQMAIDIAAKVNEAKKPKTYTLAFLKEIVSLLAPSLDTIKLAEVTSSLSLIYNKKLKEEGGKQGKKKKTKKKNEVVVSNSNKGKVNVRNELDTFDDYGSYSDDNIQDEYDLM